MKMTILQEILKNNKLLSESYNFNEFSAQSYNDRELYWENKVKLVAKIAEESELINFDVEYWKKMPCAVLTLIYDLYTKTETKNKEPKIGDKVRYVSPWTGYQGKPSIIVEYEALTERKWVRVKYCDSLKHGSFPLDELVKI